MYIAPRPLASDDPLFAVRLAVGSTLALGIAFLIQSQMPMLIPALTVGLMGGMRKTYDIKKGIGGPVMLVVVTGFFYLLMSTLHTMPWVALMAVALVSTASYYSILKTGNPMGMLLLVAVVLMSIMGAKSIQAMDVIKQGFIEGAVTALFLIPVMYLIFPARAKEPLQEIYTPDPHGNHWRRAFIRTLVLLLLLAWLYSVLDTSNMILAIAAIFVLVFPTNEMQFREAKERTYATLLGGGLALLVLGLISILGHFSLLLILVTASGLYLGDRMMQGHHSPMVYQFALSVFFALTVGGLTNQEPISATLLRVSLTLSGAIGAAYLCATLESIFVSHDE